MADVAQKSEFQVGDGATPEEFTTVAELVSISGPSISHTAVDVTNLADTMKTFIASAVADPGEVTLELNFEPDSAQHDALIDLLIAGTAGNYRVVFTDFGKAQTFTADTVNDEIDIATHGQLTGTPVRFTTTVTLPAGLSLLTTYWLSYQTAGTLSVHTTNAAAIADTPTVDITDAGTGTHTANTSAIWTFSATLTGAEPALAIDDKLGISLTFKLSDTITTTVA